MGHLIDESRIKPDPDKVSAIQHVPVPTDIGDIRRFLKTVNQMCKFAPKLADWLNKTPKRCTRKKKSMRVGSITAEGIPRNQTHTDHGPSFSAIWSGLWDDALSGCILIRTWSCFTQRLHEGELKPAVYISQSMTTTEQRYAQIEKETLALTWRFSIKFHIYTDHKPLVPLLSTKRLEDVPLRVPTVSFAIVVLSRAPVSAPTSNDCTVHQEASAFN